MTIFGYARVSTLEQNLDRQTEALKNEGCHEIYTDKFSGATLERPELKKLFDRLQEGDTIIIVDMTRFSRSTKDLFDLVDTIRDRKCFLKSIKDTWLDITSNNPYSEFLLTVMAGVSQLERNLIKMRQAEGIALAKKRGIYKGKPKKFTLNNPRIKHALELYQSGAGLSIKKCADMVGVSDATFYRAWKEFKSQEDGNNDFNGSP